MGLIRAGAGALGGTMADQWKEFFYCDAIDKDTLVVKGAKRTSSRSSNTKGNDNIISSGSGIAVADGQCMIIVEQGKVVEVCAEPGQFTYDASTEPSIFSGSLGQAILDTFKTIGKRFTLGGDTGKDQRVYYFNTKEIVDNRFGTATPIPFRIVDNRILTPKSDATAFIPIRSQIPCCFTQTSAATLSRPTSARRSTRSLNPSLSAHFSRPLHVFRHLKCARTRSRRTPLSFATL